MPDVKIPEISLREFLLRIDNILSLSVFAPVSFVVASFLSDGLVIDFDGSETDWNDATDPSDTIMT